ncbi:polysaccharide deacetylase [Pontibacter ummariensis]|uniref:Polysaccharide deacetylase n=1 Tax=Pontibacter ummariensis TaxID=1610492 RepID=A0A239G0X2_9BACT|nr:polysaccharide deacetylase family protein [Pontibacter ummariensis]PRY11695.1 polysaccharide deacetylase [Pontibacter ummariensis]SNS62700.1 Polysaccharide deacetylase [Pontibacter ummariensis]
MFTGDEFADGGATILHVLKEHDVKASFFLTGRFYHNPAFQELIRQLKTAGHYLGAHSDGHLLYCDWAKRDSLLVTQEQFRKDLALNYSRMKAFGVDKEQARYFLPPYEWYNSQIAAWTKAEGLQLVNFSPGTRTPADYTWPEMGKGYVASDRIVQSVLEKEAKDPNGLNGFILLVHIGTDPRRTDKFYKKLDELLTKLQHKGYSFSRINQLLD